MKYFSHSFIFIVILSISSVGFGQNYPFRSISEKEADSYMQRMNEYDSGIAVADSLLESYKEERFDVKMDNGSSYAVGSGFIRNCYAKLHNLKLSESHCLDKVVEIDQIIAEEDKAEHQKQYQKIVDKAGQYYDAKNYTKAVELYERALGFRPEDAEVQAKLELAKSKLD